MKNTVILFATIFLVSAEITSCTKYNDESIEIKIKNQREVFQDNIENVLNCFGFQGKYSTILLFHEAPEHSKQVLSEQIITKRIYGKAEFSDEKSYPNNTDGLWEEKSYTANYDHGKETDDSKYGYFSAIIIIDGLDKERQDKLTALMNYSVANSNRGDVINVVSRDAYANPQ